MALGGGCDLIEGRHRPSRTMTRVASSGLDGARHPAVTDNSRLHTDDECHGTMTTDRCAKSLPQAPNAVRETVSIRSSSLIVPPSPQRHSVRSREQGRDGAPRSNEHAAAASAQANTERASVCGHIHHYFEREGVAEASTAGRARANQSGQARWDCGSRITSAEILVVNHKPSELRTPKPLANDWHPLGRTETRIMKRPAAPMPRLICRHSDVGSAPSLRILLRRTRSTERGRAVTHASISRQTARA